MRGVVSTRREGGFSATDSRRALIVLKASLVSFCQAAAGPSACPARATVAMRDDDRMRIGGCDVPGRRRSSAGTTRSSMCENSRTCCHVKSRVNRPHMP
jgi:hypothetical protein